MLSTLHITDNITLFSIDRFAYAHMLGVPFPLSLQANKAERAVAFDSHGWSLIPEVEYSDSIYHIDDDRDNFFSSENIMNFFQDCVLPLGKEEFPLKPLYIKKPHITFSSAHTAPLSLDAPL